MCLIYTVYTYNKLVKQREIVDNSWSQIDILLKKRYDLVPNLVEAVKGYAKHEDKVLNDVTRARASVGGANSIQQSLDANNELSGAISRLLVVAEKYPELKANTNFLSLQQELSEIETKIAFSRQFYNDSAMSYNQRIKSFPALIIAKIFKFTEKPYFTISEEEKSTPKVAF